MSDWRIRQQYGFGAGQVRLSPAGGSLANSAVSPLAGLTQVGSELRAAGASRTLKRVGLVGTTLGLGLLLLISMLLGVEADRMEETDLQIVELVLPEPVVEQAPAEVASLPVQQPVQAVAEVVPQAPARVMPPRPEIPAVPLPAPVEPSVLQASMREPEPIRQAPRPKVQIAAVERVPDPATEVTARASRIASERAPSKVRPVVSVDPVSQKLAERPSRSVPTRVARAARPAVEKAVGRSPARVAPVSLAVSSSHGQARGRIDARPQPLRSALPSDRLAGRSQKPAALAVSSLASSQRSSAPQGVTRASSRSLMSTPAFTTAARAEMDDGLEGVPLSSLAACMSDREEDALKLDVLAAVSRPTECVSPAGRYQFVETKNLNAFLMRIERSPHRKEVDRCVELRHALDCIQGQGQYGGST